MKRSISILLLLLTVLLSLFGCSGGGNSENNNQNQTSDTTYSAPVSTTTAIRSTTRVTYTTKTPSTTAKQGRYYVLNTSSRKFHYPSCGSAARISEKNRSEFYGNREELISKGYSPCGNCDP